MRTRSLNLVSVLSGAHAHKNYIYIHDADEKLKPKRRFKESREDVFQYVDFHQ